jgi:ElaB/YqjD/DUF883 family membrane-anchored ribosome-binding protein
MNQETDVATSKAQLIEDFGKVVADTEALLRSIAEVGGEKAATLRGSVEANLNAAKARLRDLQGTAAETASAAFEEADDYVRENPWAAVGIAAAVGVVIGLMLGSRRN